MGEKKKIAVMVRSAPIGSVRASEALRSAVGTTMADDEVTLILAGDGVYCLLDNDPGLVDSLPIKKHLEALKVLGKTIIAEKESLDERGLEDIEGKVASIKTRAEVARLLIESDHVVVW